MPKQFSNVFRALADDPKNQKAPALSNSFLHIWHQYKS
jgi:hypothetical protein